MRVKSVERDDQYFRSRIYFEHNGVKWFKYFDDDDYWEKDYFKNFLNSVLEDYDTRMR